MSKTFFISFSGNVNGVDADLAARQRLLNKSAILVSKADKEIAWTHSDLLNTDFYKQNKWLLDQTRGAGFWSWKPYIILQTLNKVGVDDWVVYSDSGKPFRRGDPERCGNNKIGNVMNTPFDALIAFAKQQNGFTPGVWVPHYGDARVWTKRDCFVGMGCDTAEYHNSGQVQAGYSCWSNSKASRDFLTQWLYWCQVQAIISDRVNIYGKPNFAEFRDHRHDQSIITNIVIKNKIDLFGSKTQSLEGYRDFNFIIRNMALATTLKGSANDLSTLFDSPPLLPKYLNKPLQLLLLPDLNQKSTIKVDSPNHSERWQTAFKNCEVQTSAAINRSNSLHNYDAIFANDCSNEELLEQHLVQSYESLNPGGILVMGPFSGTTDAIGKLNGSFAELVKWMFTNQCFPPHLSSKKNQASNSLTIGNAHNPFLVSIEPDKNYILLRKPMMSLLDNDPALL